MTTTTSPPSQSSDLSIKAAASLTPCCVRTLRKEIARGRLRAYRIANRIFVKPEHFAAFLQERAVPVTPDGVLPKVSNNPDQPNHHHQHSLGDAEEGVTQ